MLGIFLDIESNGLNSFKHRVLEIAIKILDLENFNEIALYEAIVFQPLEVWGKSDPVSLSINGFDYERVKTGKTEKTVANEIDSLFLETGIDRSSAVFICQNPSFDRTFFSQLIDADVQEAHHWPYHWLDLASMYWTTRLKESKDKNIPPPWETGISKNNIAKEYGIAPEENPHRAMNGVDHLITCYKRVNNS